MQDLTSPPCRQPLKPGPGLRGPKTLPLVLLGLLLSLHCSSLPLRVQTQVDAYSTPEAAASKVFVLQGPDPGEPDGDPQYPVFARCLTLALAAKGYLPASPGAKPALVIRLSYGVGEPIMETIVSSTPVMGPSGTEVQTVVTTDPFNPTAPPMVTTVSVPAMGSVGTVDTTTFITTFKRTIQVEALEAATSDGRPPRVLWRTHAASRGSEEDLGAVFPYMMAAMGNYFGVTTPQTVTLVTYRGDPEVERLRPLKP
jgi:hypothetical protein